MNHTVRTHELIESFSDALLSEKGASKNTVSSYVSDLNIFFANIKKPPTEVNTDDIKYYLAKCANNSARTNNRKLSSLKAFFNFLISEGIITSSPSKDIETAKASHTIPRFLSPEQMEQLIEVCNNYKDSADRFKLIILLLYSSGVRVSELLSIKTSMIDFKECTVTVMGKGGKERLLPIDPGILDFIKSMKINGYLFKASNSDKPLTRQRIFQIVKKLGQAISVDDLSPHKIRHSFATHMLNNGANILTIQNLLGHTDVSTTEIYTHVLSSRLAESIKKHHPMSS